MLKGYVTDDRHGENANAVLIHTPALVNSTPVAAHPASCVGAGEFAFERRRDPCVHFEPIVEQTIAFEQIRVDNGQRDPLKVPLTDQI
jgi:hypothetical protein